MKHLNNGWVEWELKETRNNRYSMQWENSDLGLLIELVADLRFKDKPIIVKVYEVTSKGLELKKLRKFKHLDIALRYVYRRYIYKNI